jgi:alpha-tubulin suppressor-like RCC1 family protein
VINLRQKLQIQERIQSRIRAAVFIVAIIAVSVSTFFSITNQADAAVSTWTPANMTEIQSTGVKYGSLSRTCGIESGKMYCWGQALLGRDDVSSSPLMPIPVDTSGVLAGKTITHFVLLSENTCVLTSDSGVYCWGQGAWGTLGNGSNDYTFVPVAVDKSGVLAGKTITSLQGTNDTMYVVADGQAYAWGDISNAGTGSATNTKSNVPVAVDTSGALAGKTIAKLAISSQHTCALTTDNNIVCWGFNYSGELGNGETYSGSVTSPVVVNQTGVLANKTITDLLTMDGVTCAIADGGAYCWGHASGGELGTGDPVDSYSDVPVAVDTSTGLGGKVVIKMVASLAYSICALTSDSGVYCWGNNDFGLSGNSSLTGPQPFPQPIEKPASLAGKNITDIEPGYFSMFIVADGQIYGWGDNNTGALGVGGPINTSDDSIVSVPTPIDASGVLSGKSIDSFTPANGSTTNCAIADGQPICWGFNDYGALGNNTTINSSSPVAVQTPVPQLESIDMTAVPMDGQTHSTTLRGEGFGPGSTVKFGSITAVVNTVSETSLTVTIPSAAFTSNTNVNVTVTDSFGHTSTLSNAFTFTVVPPTIGLLRPSSMDARAGASSQIVQIFGTNFQPGSQVSFGSQALSTTYVSSSELDVVVPNPIVQNDQQVDVTVTDSNGHVTNPGDFTYLSYKPTFSTYNPVTNLTIDGVSKIFYIYGTNFDNATVTTNVLGSTYAIQDQDTMLLTLPTSGLTQNTSVDMTVTNSYGETATFTNMFTLTLPGASTTQVTSTQFTNDGGQEELIVQGTQFPNYTGALGTSLIKMNGINLPFCTTNTGGNAAQFIQAYGMPADAVSDSPPCYLLIGPGSQLVFTATQATILLANDYDITAPGSVSVGGSPEYLFNQTAGGGTTTGGNTGTGSGTTTDAGGGAVGPVPKVTSSGSSSNKKGDTTSTQTQITQPTTTNTTDMTVTPTVLTDGSALSSVKTIDAQATFSGIATPLSTVIVTAHSDPVTCTTKADMLGRWSCSLPSALPAGNHTVQVAVTDPDGKTTTLGPYAVTVASVQPPDTSGTASSTTSPLKWLWLLLPIGVVVLIVVLAVTSRRKTS